MPPRRNDGAVRGPASALTSFLQGLGVEPSTRLTTWGNSSHINPADTPADDHLAADGPVNDEAHLDPAGAVTARTVEAGPSAVAQSAALTKRGGDEQIAPLAKRSRKRASSMLSDDLDVAGPSKAATPEPQGPSSLKAIGEPMACGECGKGFTVTAYTKEHPKKSTWICVPCCYTLNIDPFEKQKKPKAKPAKKEDRGKLVHYDQRKGVNSLGDMCIQLIGRYIEDVEQLGDIGGINMDRVCRIISKSRKLTPETAPLFYSPDRKDLTMYDCTRLVHQSYLTLANLCPNLETLHLHLCGQLSTEAVTYWGERLPLKRLELFAPFLVRKPGWLELFKLDLQGFLVTQSPRIDAEIVQSLVTHCPNLTELRLSQVGQLNSDCLVPLAQLKHLVYLDLSSPDTSLTDDAVVSLLGAVGETLVTLNLDYNLELSDEILPAIASCPNLRHLYLRNLPELTDAGVAGFFDNLDHPGYITLDLEKGHDLGGKAVKALIKKTGHTVEKLSLLGWKNADQESLSGLSRCSHLKELDLGWCRQVTDFTLQDILDGCEEVQSIRVWGCNQLTDAVPRKKGVKVIGIETHSI